MISQWHARMEQTVILILAVLAVSSKVAAFSPSPQLSTSLTASAVSWTRFTTASKARTTGAATSSTNLPMASTDSAPETSRAEGEDGDDALLNDVDARVLQSMLRDTKLNLQEEENMKRLLERGVKKETPQDAARGVQAQKELEEVPYSSQVLQTLGNTKLWKGLTRNAADVFESARIWAQNKVERDAKLVASLGIFAFERALTDVSRALPAAGSVVKKVAPKLQLPETSSSASMNQNREDTMSQNIRSQMTTPADEFQSVANELRTILTSGGERRSGDQGGIVASSRGLKSTASSKMGKNRFLKAYQRQKETTLKKEKENLVQTSTRLAGSVMDSAYQVQRDLQVEPNQPGYKTKALRDGAVETSKLLASGAKGLLSGAKAVAQAALPSTAEPPNTALPPTSESNPAAPTDPFMGAGGVDASVADGYARFASQSSNPSVSDAPVNARIPGTSANSDISSLYGSPPSPPIEDTTAEPSQGGSAEEPFFFASRDAPNFEEAVASGQSSAPSDDDFTFTARRFTEEEAGEGVLVDPEDMANAFFAQPSTPGEETIVSEVDAEVVEVTPENFASAGPGFFSAEPVETVDVAQTASSFYVDDVVTDVEDDIVLPDEDPQDTLRRVRAEIVSDEDFEVAVGQAKEVDNTAGQEVDFPDTDEEKEPGVFTVATLRVLDVLFLVLEKVVLVSNDYGTELHVWQELVS